MKPAPSGWQAAGLLAAGIGEIGAGAIGEVGGGAADSTGIGAVGGIALGAVSLMAIKDGIDKFGSGYEGAFGSHHPPATTVGSSNDTPDTPARPAPGSPLESESASNSPNPTKTDRIKEHLTPKDLDAARRELSGEVVARKSTGEPWDHVGEVRDAQNGLVNRISQLKKQMGDSRATPEQRSAAQKELSEASELLDRSEQFVPRTTDPTK